MSQEECRLLLDQLRTGLLLAEELTELERVELLKVVQKEPKIVSDSDLASLTQKLR